MAPYNTTQFLLEDHEKRTMPPDIGDSFPAVAAHQRQSTGGFSPNRERFILFPLLQSTANKFSSSRISLYCAFQCSGIIKLHVLILLVLTLADVWLK